MLYPYLKDAHNILRWFVLLSLLFALFRTWSGLISHRPWAKGDRVSGAVFTGFLNLQVILGLVLAAFSPLMHSIFADFGAAMKNPVLRFFAVEHPFAMILAAIIAQGGFSLSKRAPTDAQKFRRAAFSYLIAGVLIVAAIPWPFLKYGRPLLPGLGH